VMTNLWIYRKRLGQDAQSVASLASGKMAEYSPFAYNGGLHCTLTRLSERCR